MGRLWISYEDRAPVTELFVLKNYRSTLSQYPWTLSLQQNPGDCWWGVRITQTSHVGMHDHNVIEFRKLALVGIIPNQLLSFSSDKDRRTDSLIRRKKKTAQPRWESKTLGSIDSRRGCAAFFRLIRLSVLLLVSLSELKEKSWLDIECVCL